jgi:uracil-DNA glycosylase family protein
MPRRSARDPPRAPDAEPSKETIDGCRRCELWESSTQGVPGEGPPGARVVLVGEQPGNDEDLVGRPFVGPAGRLLRELLEQAGIPQAEVFLTNAVKHFYYELRGKRRIHKTPLQRHVAACHVWLDAELAKSRPRVIVTLGATALGAVLGRRMSIGEARQSTLVHDPTGIDVVATYHPSAVLRVPDAAARETLRGKLLEDLERARRLASAKRGRQE